MSRSGWPGWPQEEDHDHERVKREDRGQRRRRGDADQEWLRERIRFELATRLNGERRIRNDMERKIN